MTQTLELLDFRRQVADLYRQVRMGNGSEETWEAWRVSRDHLFTTHPQSAIEDQSKFSGLPFFEFDPNWRTVGRFVADDETAAVVDHSGAGTTTFRKVGNVEFELFGQTRSLEVLWLDAYGGGAFIPFRDQTNGHSTYGGGRYLIDTVKGADLGQTETGLILDFNYAYHPSCVHSDRWSCPLAPVANRLDIEVRAGEQLVGFSEGRESQ